MMGSGKLEAHGGDDRRSWRCRDLAVAAAAGWLHAGNQRTRQGEAAGTAAARGGAAAVAAAEAEAAVGLLPCSSLSSHLRGMIILSFFK